MEDYENLAFKPELTWEDLCDWADDKAERGNNNFWFNMILGESAATFFKDGEVTINGGIVAENKTPAQMQAIITALWGE